MNIQRKAYAAWQGDIRHGKGTLTTESKALSNTPYSFATRFESLPGTNPEELLGAAHAGCFTMALTHILGEAGIKLERIDTGATVSLERVEGALTITHVHLDVTVKAPGADRAKVIEAAQKAKANCPLSKVLRAEISMDAKLAG
ncbi:MAG TPA: OsmC family protein [Steroidobacteraceae bacterium]|jgi:osmotically inducible protein OsmC|nr:OsmC family protein [Steroidobacteraceae bacterium]